MCFSCFVLLTRYWGIVTVPAFPRLNRHQTINWGGWILTLHLNLYLFQKSGWAVSIQIVSKIRVESAEPRKKEKNRDERDQLEFSTIQIEPDQPHFFSSFWVKNHSRIVYNLSQSRVEPFRTQSGWPCSTPNVKIVCFQVDFFPNWAASRHPILLNESC